VPLRQARQATGAGPPRDHCPFVHEAQRSADWLNSGGVEL
jgi:ribosome modulation factor